MTYLPTISPSSIKFPAGSSGAFCSIPRFNQLGLNVTVQSMKIETLAVHAGHAIDPATGAVAAPIYLSTTFERDVEGAYARGFMYSRNDNPNRQALERGINALEGGAAAAAFASGTGATMSILQALA